MTRSKTPPAPPEPRPTAARSPGWRSPLRVAAPLVTALLWTQPLLIGLFLAGDFDRLAVHATVGGVLVLAVFLQFALSVPAWRPGGMPGWAVAVAAAMVAGAVVQIAAGYQRNLGLHVPLGVTLAAAGAAVTIAAWLPAGSAAAASGPAATGAAGTPAPAGRAGEPPARPTPADRSPAGRAPVEPTPADQTPADQAAGRHR